MQTFCLFSIFFFLLLLSCAPSPLSYASSLNLGRRHLSDDAAGALLTPASPISPPFFPLESSAPPLPPPPPPPTFAAFPTFPANISALVLPRSPKPHSTSPALLVPAISAVLVVATVIGVALFLYGRWRGQNRHFKDTTTRGSDSSSSHSHGYDEEEEPRHVITTNNFSVSASSPTSEVLYLGGEEEPDHVVTSFAKPPESPEIRPLPPLPRSFQPSYEADERNNNNNQEEEEDVDEEEEEEFFSPLASLANSANSSPSRSEFEQSSSSSSSGWVSPARSFSMTLSPIQQQRSFSRLSDVSSSDRNLHSPSPDRLRRVRNGNGYGSSSLRMFSFFNQNLSFPRISSASTSPERGGFVRTPLSSLYSSVSNSPDGLFRKFVNSSPPIWNDFSRNVKSVLLSSESVSSRRDFVINIGGQAAVPAPLPPPTRPPPLVPPSQSFVVQHDGRKPSFSDKLGQGSCQTTAWDCLKTSSFKLNKEIVETLFISNSSSPNVNQRGLTYEHPTQSEVLYQNIATRLQLLNLTTKDVCNALLEGDSDALGAELLDCLSRLAPSKDEERKLRNASDDSVFIKLGPAERFLKELLQVPFVFKRVDALLSVANFYPEVEYLRRSFGVVQAACEELRNNKTFSRLLEAILKTGNKMSVGTNSHAFKFDTLLKLAEVKGLDGTSTVLHFVVQEMIKSEGSVKALDLLRNLSSEMETVKKSAGIEYGVLLTNGVLKLCQGIKNIKELLILSEESGCSGDQWLKFEVKMARFLETAAGEILKIKAQESSTLSAMEEVTELFHGGSSKEEGHTLRVFMAVRDFLTTLDEVCNEMGDRFSA